MQVRQRIAARVGLDRIEPLLLRVRMSCEKATVLRVDAQWRKLTATMGRTVRRCRRKPCSV